MNDEDASNAEIPDDERDALLSIAHGAVVTGGGVSIQRVLLTVTEFLLVRGLGPVLYGVFAFGWRIVMLLQRFVTFGTAGTLQRDVPAFENRSIRQRRVAGLAYATTIAAGICLGIGLYLTADWINAKTVSESAFPLTLSLFAVLLGILGIIRTHAALLRAVSLANLSVLLNRVLRPAVRLVTAVGALALGFSIYGVAGAIVLGTGLLAIISFPIVVRYTRIRPTLQGSRDEARAFYNHAVPNALSGVGKLFQSRIDVLLIGILLTATAAGIYNIVLLFVSIAAIPLIAFNQLLPPVASSLYSDGKTETLNTVYTAVTRLVVTSTVPLIAVQLVFGRELLLLFGESFSRGYLTLVVFLVGRLTGNAVGATGWLLLMTNHQYARLGLDWFLGGLNLVLSYIFVVEFGLVGAALGTSASMAIQNLIQVGLLRRFEGLWPFDVTFLKPLGSGLVMVGIMVGVRVAFDGVFSIGIGAVVGVIGYLGLLAMLGINPRDRFVARELAARYRDTTFDVLSRIK